MAVKGPGVNAKKWPFSGEKSGLCLACDAECRWMRGTLRAQVRARTAGQGMNVPHDGYFYITLPGRVE